MREESGCFVSIVKADFRHVQERIMVLKGSVEQIAAATKGIAILSDHTRIRMRESRPEPGCAADAPSGERADVP